MISYLRIIPCIFPIFIHVIKAHSVSESCSENCQCSDCPLNGLQNLTEVTCNVSSLQEIAVPSRENICSLVLSRNGISSLNKKFLKPFDGILSLDLSFNVITKLSTRVFSTVPSLKTLYLQHNNITAISVNAFRGLRSLKKLCLNENFISEIEAAGFSWLSQLQYLFINHNRIKALPGNTTFKGLRSLVELDLRHNRLANLTNEMFRGMLSVKTLDLSYNEIVVLSFDALNYRQNLQQVNVSHNAINALTGNTTFRILISLFDLDLSHNGLEILTSNIFRGITTLTILYLHHNNITTIQASAFFGLRNLKQLYLQHNNITTIQASVFFGLRDLKQLYLSNNLIFKIEQAGFYGLLKLQYLDLSYNKLEILTKDMFRVPTLKNLSLQHNWITFIQPNTFAGLRDLETLDLSYNRIVTLSFNVFKGLRNLKHINLDGNNITKVPAVNETDKANKTQGTQEAPNNEIKGCHRIQRKQVVVYVPRNKTVCVQRRNCTLTVIMMNRTKLAVTSFHICWDVTNKLRPLMFILGIIAILSNLLVITTVVFVRSLLRSPPFLLVSAMASCDFLVGVYSFGMAFGHGYDIQEFKAWKNTYCPYFRNLFILAEIVGGLTSLLMTIERYVAIVFCMKPDIRLGHKAIRVCLPLFWIAGATTAAMVQVFDTRYGQNIGQMCLIHRNSQKIPFLFISEILMLFLVFIYILLVVFYLHIFIIVRKSARNAGVLRESRLAKRISLIVLTSFVFFAAPNFVLAWFIINEARVFEDAWMNRTLIWWLPPVCLIVNACLNPFIFAFKNDKFSRALRKMAGRLPGGGILMSRKKAREDRPFTLESHPTSQGSLNQGIELTMYTIAETGC